VAIAEIVVIQGTVVLAGSLELAEPEIQDIVAIADIREKVLKEIVVIQVTQDRMALQELAGILVIRDFQALTALPEQAGIVVIQEQPALPQAMLAT
jgi:hypothetical protein